MINAKIMKEMYKSMLDAQQLLDTFLLMLRKKVRLHFS